MRRTFARHARQGDALRFALAACQVIAGEGGKFTNDLIQETARATRIRLNAANREHGKKPSPDYPA
jgi:hypothetical protein